MHSPHASVHGCNVLTFQTTEVGSQGYDFNLAEPGGSADGSAESPAKARMDPMPERATPPPDMALEEVPTEDRPETEKLGPTDDNPSNPTTG